MKAGSGTLSLAGTNTYTGGTTINAGTLKIDNSSTGDVLSDIGFVTLANVNGATLNLNGKTETIGSLSGGGASGGNITLGTGGALTVNQTTNTSYNGAISGDGSFTKTSYGVLTLNGVNTYTGATTLSGGEVVIGVSNAIPNTSLVFANAARLLLIHDGVSAEIGSLTSEGVTGSVIWLYNRSVLTVNQSVDRNYDGSIISNVMGSVVKNLSGTLTLRGTNTYLGGTTINAGTLRIDGSSSLNNGDYRGSITNNGILRYSSSTPQYLRGTYSGSGTLSDDTSNLNFI